MNYLMRLSFTVLLGALTALPGAAAQTRIGQVTFTPVRPAPTPPSAADYAWQAVPAGMNEVRGEIATPSARQPLPAGTQIRVSVINTATGLARSVANATFTTMLLPTTYQLFYGHARLISGQPYLVRCIVTDASGRVLFRGADVPLPRLPRAVLNLKVKPAATLP